MTRTLSIAFCDSSEDESRIQELRCVAEVAGGEAYLDVESEHQVKELIDKVRTLNLHPVDVQVDSHLGRLETWDCSVLTGAIVSAEYTADLDVHSMDYGSMVPCRSYAPPSGPVCLLESPSEILTIAGDCLIFKAAIAEYYESCSDARIREVFVGGRRDSSRLALQFYKQYRQNLCEQYLPLTQRKCLACGGKLLRFPYARISFKRPTVNAIYCNDMGLNHRVGSGEIYLPVEGLGDFDNWTHGLGSFQPVFDGTKGPGSWTLRFLRECVISQ